MALVPSVMANLIVTQLEALNPDIDTQPGARAKLLTQWTGICTGIITHITTAGVVNTTDTITSNGATTAGPPGGPLPIVGLPGTGSGIGTMS